jgi:hypothetical protein
MIVLFLPYSSNPPPFFDFILPHKQKNFHKHLLAFMLAGVFCQNVPIPEPAIFVESVKNIIATQPLFLRFLLTNAWEIDKIRVS